MLITKLWENVRHKLAAVFLATLDCMIMGVERNIYIYSNTNTIVRWM